MNFSREGILSRAKETGYFEKINCHNSPSPVRGDFADALLPSSIPLFSITCFVLIHAISVPWRDTKRNDHYSHSLLFTVLCLFLTSKK